MRRVHAVTRPALHQDEGLGKCMLKEKTETDKQAARFGFHRVCVCLLSLALVLPQYSKHYIKAKIGDTITQAKCKCRQHHQSLHLPVAKLISLGFARMSESLLSLSLN